MSMDYRSFERLRDNLLSLNSDIKPMIEKFLLDEAQKVLTLTTDNTPYITGHLRANWELSEIRRRGDKIEVSIINNIKYASFVEYGHLSTKGKWVDGKFMCTLAIDEIKRKMNRDFSIALERYLRDRGQ